MADARAAAAAWSQRQMDAAPRVVGAICTGSAIESPEGEVLSPSSDVDVLLVVDGPAPTPPGKLRFRDVLLDVSYIGCAELADPERVARTHYLAPSFSRPGGILADRDGRLGLVAAAVAPLFNRPEVVWDRCRSVLRRMDAGLSTLAGNGTWPQEVLAALFPISLSTHVLLVAGRRNPTVRLRYLRTRELLSHYGLPEVYEELLDHLGARTVSADVVRRHLPALETAFDAAARCGSTAFPFAGDITRLARPVAVGGTEALVAQGGEREAVFWLMVTLARSQLILDDVGDAAASESCRARFLRACSDLTGLHGPPDLPARQGVVKGFRPRLEALARRLIDASG